MSCKSNPVNINNKTKQICKQDCSYQFNYNKNSSAIVANLVDYLDIKVDGSNTVKFNSYAVNLQDVRLYQPSLHLFDGQQAAAELVISHSGYGNNVLVCIPIKAGDGNGKSNNFFSQIMQHVPPKTDNKTKSNQNINVTNWSLNDVVPSGTFYFYIGKFPYPPCNGKNNIIVFDLNSAANINSKDLELLKTLINPVQYSQDQTLGSVAARTPLLMVNRAATGGGAAGPSSSGQEYYIFDQCEAIDGMEDEAKKSPPTISPSWVTFIMLLLGGLIIFALMYSFLGGIGSDSGASADGTSTSATASSA
jgi:carbonic anhydrase